MKSTVVILLFSLFFPSQFFTPLVAFFIFTFIVFRILFSYKFFIIDRSFYFFYFIFFIWSIICTLYNVIFTDNDGISWFIWLSTYSFPLISAIIISQDRLITIDKFCNIFFTLLLSQSLIQLWQAIDQKDFFGDHMSGTCFDAHMLGIYFIFGSIISFFKFYFNKKYYSLFYCILFFLGAIFTGATSQLALFLGLLLPILVYLFIINIKKIHNVKLLPLYVVILIILCFPLLNKTHGFGYIEQQLREISQNFSKIDVSTHMGKIRSFKQLLMDIPYEINIYVGYGPGRYTSRASQMRIPDIPTIKLPIDLGSNVSPLFQKFIYPWYYEGDYPPSKGFSWGTAASPMTSISTIGVELGYIGLIIFFLLILSMFLNILSKIIKLKHKNSTYLFFSISTLVIFLFFFLDLFYLNYWEYPQMTFPVFCMYFLTYKV